ncbi:unnamed protein product [Spirodela intermedia]|uniref:S-acyltransferase n=1 Tax=Spirodela intermedia TaxID=51605 RepID=A0A7I8K3Q3_SPIIN|nr:unnamed protein product [Spirodela intermedia]
MGDEVIKEESFVVCTPESHETVCWGCGLRLLLSSYSPIFKCGWCGAITNHNYKRRKPDSTCFSRWRRVRDRLFISIVFLFMFFVVGGGLWAIYPIIFSISYLCGVFHCSIAGILSISTMFTFFLASSCSPGTPLSVVWGDYAAVSKGSLEDYTFCTYCARPKPPRAHHCRSCRICVLDMDHHCPFISNCVGAGNHRYFVSFLISAVVSCTYIVAMAAFAWHRMWPPLVPGRLASSVSFYSSGSTGIFKRALIDMADAALMLSPRGLLLLYLGISSLSILIGISVLLWQQLRYIYEGQTYLIHLSSQDGGGFEDKGCQNILRFFGCPHWAYRLLLVSSYPGKLHETTNSKLL